jgi:proteasome lid subunit RPN8/RPN11
MLKIPEAIYEELIAHTMEGFPLEVCGILGGIGNTVSATYRMVNTDASNKHFTMEPKEQFAVAKDLRAKSLSMLAIYHSHPETTAKPSEEDIKLALTPDVSYVIVSFADAATPSVNSYKIYDGEVATEEIEVIPYAV